MRKTAVFAIFILIFTFNFKVAGEQKNTESVKLSQIPLANELYKESLIQHRESNIDSAIVLLQKAVEIDDNFAEAYNQLCIVYIDKETVYHRTLAERAIKKAIELKPNEIKYKVHYVTLILEQGLIYNAKKKNEYILTLDHTNIKNYLEMGEKYKEKMESYKDMVSGPDEKLPNASDINSDIIPFIDNNILGYISDYSTKTGNDPSMVTKRIKDVLEMKDELQIKYIDFTKFVKEDFKNAVTAYTNVLEIEPHNKDALHNLSLLSMEVNLWEQFISYRQEIAVNYPDDKNAHLFLGFGYHMLKSDDSAFVEYEKAKTLMVPDEKAVFEAIEYIVPSGEIKDYKKLESQGKSEYNKTFWKQKDPLFLSEYNERIIEHYSRVAYANLKFGVEKMNLSGWKTDRGMIYIRYGKPKLIKRLRPEIDKDLNEIWYYDDYTFVFGDPFSSGKYSLKYSRFPVEFDNVALATYQKTPEKYEHKFKGNKFDIAYYTANFRGDKGKPLVETYYAIPVNELKPKEEKNLSVTTLKEGMFFFDDKWNEVDKLVTKEKIYLPPQIDSTKNYYVIGMNQLEIAPGDYNFAVEIREEESKNTGAQRSKLKVDSYPVGRLNISDIVLAANIIPSDKEEKYVKNGLKIIPNPKKIVNKNQLMYIYFEVYNLMVSPGQKTKFSVDYKISAEPEGKKSFMTKTILNFRKFFRLKKEKQDITASYEYEGTNPNDQINLSIDISAADLGKYDLTVKIKDLNSGDEISKKIRFAVQKDMVNYLF